MDTMKLASSKDAQKAYKLVKSLQNRFVSKLDLLSEKMGENKKFQELTWLRNSGHHGGGNRFESRDEKLFNTASVNVSQVHYDDLQDKSLLSASALSTIIHPKNPHIPSIHIHISLTELRDGSSYWRLMADLNPSIFNEEDKNNFDAMLERVSKHRYKEATQQGDKYFNIPALKRHRGVSHFYLENYKTENKEEDFNFAKDFTEAVIDTYVQIIESALQNRCSYSSRELALQLKYHTLYLFQVLTLDRGTTSGLLIHDENDIGIMGSLPACVDKALLHSWAKKVPSPQDILVEEIANAINTEGEITLPIKAKLASIVRTHYEKYPESLKLQASANTPTTTLENHTL